MIAATLLFIWLSKPVAPVGTDIVPAIPSEYSAFFEQDPVVGPALQNADGRYTKMVRPPAGGDFVSPVGYALGSDIDFSVDFCVLNPQGFMFDIANYDENKDGELDTIYAVYMPSANGTVDGECQPRIVVAVEPAVFK